MGHPSAPGDQRSANADVKKMFEVVDWSYSISRGTTKHGGSKTGALQTTDEAHFSPVQVVMKYDPNVSPILQQLCAKGEKTDYSAGPGAKNIILIEDNTFGADKKPATTITVNLIGAIITHYQAGKHGDMESFTIEYDKLTCQHQVWDDNASKKLGQTTYSYDATTGVVE
jgi:type VI protein secretion system component Hcp